MPKLADKLKGLKPGNEPLWKGPQVEGITYSLLSRYLVDKERFRLKVIEGLSPPESFNIRIEYGNMWHTCEEAFAISGNPIVSNPTVDSPWLRALLKYARELGKKFPTQGAEIKKWVNICALQFPIYVDWWKRHPDVKARKPLAAEQEFGVPLELPSGREVFVLGKMDSLDLLPKEGIWLQENKAKGDIDELQHKRNLTFDLQTMMYSTIVQEQLKMGPEKSNLSWLPELLKLGSKHRTIAGVRYNVIRRPLAGGKHSIRQKQNQTEEEFYEELAERIRGAQEEDGTHFFFKRWRIELSPNDIGVFTRTCLYPLLENVTDDYEWWSLCYRQSLDPFDYLQRAELYPHHQNRHYRYPYGVYNALLEGGSTELDEYLANGSQLGLTRSTRLFPELRMFDNA